MRRIGFVLFALAGLSAVIAVISFGFAIDGAGARRGGALAYGIVNAGFSLVNAVLGFVLVASSRAT